MAVQTFSVGGMDFVSGLFWQPLSGHSVAERNKEAKSLAKEMSFDLFIIRDTQSQCVGFAKSGGRIKAGSFSAAAPISKAMEIEFDARDFIFVGQIDSGEWVYIAQKDGIILPDGDLIFPTEDHVKARLFEDLSIGQWAVISVPEIWGVKGSIDRTFESLLPRNKSDKVQSQKWWKLVPIENHQLLSVHAKEIVSIALLIGLGIYGWNYYSAYKIKKAQLEAARIAAMQIDEAGKLVPLPKPWKSIPPPSEMLSACMSAMSKITLFPGNWELKSINCSNSLLTISWAPKSFGWIEHLKEIEPSALISVDGKLASKSISLREMVSGFEDTLNPENQRLVEMYSAAQRYNVNFAASPVVIATPPVLPGQDANTPPPPTWGEVAWTVSGVDLPDIVLMALDGKGFRMNSMSAAWANGKFLWTMEGTQYVSN